mmetsp:Transcript_17028/g.37505  ORF Transcript_17028/g.37505 Transcript_17028/m.37505 type:complete len:497 (+) Transcript_17028:1562-3052(+)
MRRVHEEIGGVQPVPFRDGSGHAVDLHVGRGLGDPALSLAVHHSDPVPGQAASVVGEGLAVVVGHLDRQIPVHFKNVVHHDSSTVRHCQGPRCDAKISHLRAGSSTPLGEGLPGGVLGDRLAGGVPLDLVVQLENTCRVAGHPELHFVREGHPVRRPRHRHTYQPGLAHPDVRHPSRRRQRNHQVHGGRGLEGVGDRDGGRRLVRQRAVEEQGALGGAHDGLMATAVVVGGVGLRDAVREELELGQAQVRQVGVAAFDHHVGDGETGGDGSGGDLDVADCLCLLGIVTVLLSLTNKEALVARWVNLNPRTLGVLQRPTAVGLLPGGAARDALGRGGQGGVVARPTGIEHAVVVAGLSAQRRRQAQSVGIIHVVPRLVTVTEAISLRAALRALVLAVVRHPHRHHASEELSDSAGQVPHRCWLGLHVVQDVGLAVSPGEAVGVLAVAQHFQSAVVLGITVADGVLVAVGCLPPSFGVSAGGDDVTGKVNLENVPPRR